MFRVLTVFLLVSVVYAKHEIYEGWSNFEFEVENEAQTKYVFMLEDELGLDIWSHPGPSHSGMVLVPKDKKDEAAHKLRLAGIKFRPTVDNVKEQLDIEDRIMAAASRRTVSSDITSKAALPLDKVYTWEEVEEYMVRLARNYPDKVTLVNGGSSYEGRPINYLRISTTNFQDPSKPIVFMQSLIHSREWLTQAATLYAIEKLVVNNTESDLINDIDWIIVPTANPDGFVYSQETDRWWRKNRRDDLDFESDEIIAGLEDWCVGVDLNRNHDIDWASFSSNRTCAGDFHGTAPFSEPETSVTKRILDEYKDRIELFFDIHSYGSYVLYPYGTAILPPNALMLHRVGILIGNAIDAVKLPENPNYTVGNSGLVLYRASGGTDDYALSVGIPYAYCLELTQFRGSNTRFSVNLDLLEQGGFETFEGIKAGARFVRDNYKMRQGRQ